MKKGILLALFTVLISTLFASNKTAIDYYEAGDLRRAKQLLEATSNPDAMDYYYLGQILLRENNASAAAEVFKKGLQADPANLYNNLGLAAIDLRSNPKAAEKELKSISGNKLYKKDVAMQVAIAEAFLRNNNKVMGQLYLAKAKKADKKSALPYIMEGNLLMEQDKGNDASVMFENALYFDPNSKVALVKLAQLYLGTRRQIAFDNLDKATSIDPKYEYGWKTMADLRRQAGFYPEAREAFEKYLSLVTPTPGDHQIYGQILYFNENYDEALVALDKAADNTVTKRLKMYTKFQQDNYEEALPLAENLVKTAPKQELIYQDYSYFAQMLKANNEHLKAAEYLEEAYLLDETRDDSLTEIARTYQQGKAYDKAGEFYQKIIDSKEEPTLADYYTLGVNYYSGGNDKANIEEEQRNDYLKKATEVFAELSEHFPNHYLGHLFQARSFSAMDPETTEGLAKPYYEKVLPILMETAEERKTEIMEVYQYLGIYYLKKDDYRESREYWLKVQELDPENAIAKQVIESIDSVHKR